MGVFTGLARGINSAGARKVFSEVTTPRQEATKGVFQGLAEGVKGRLDSGMAKFPDAPGAKIGSDFLNFVHSNDTATGAFYGGAAGAVGGLMSNDRDVGMLSGASMGAVAGVRGMTKGLRGGTMGAGLAGGLYGMFSDDTSVIGGAFMGASSFASLSGKYATGFGKVRKMGGRGAYNLVGDKPSRRGVTAKPRGRGASGFRGQGGGIARAGRATYNAMKRDVGQFWRGKRSRASKNTATMGSNSGR